MSILRDFPEEIMLLDEVDVGGCVLSDNKTSIDMVLKQIWEGNVTLIDRLKGIGSWFNDDLAEEQCRGVRDILTEWKGENIRSFVFYIPRSTVRAIRKKLSQRVNSKNIVERIESSISNQGKRNAKDITIYNLEDENQELQNIFDMRVLKNELDKESKGSDKIFFIGLKYNLNSRESNIYLNNIPIAEESGLILGDSKILKNKLKKGIIEISVDEDITVEFFDTNIFTSTDIDIGDDLADIDFERDSIDIALDSEYNSPLILESKKDTNLIFSTEQNSQYQDKTFQKKRDSSSNGFNGSIEPLNTKINMESFFIPKSKELKSVSLLLLNKNGKYILAGGQYYHGLNSSEIVAQLNINFERDSITLKNYSDNTLSFANFEDDFWRLEERGAVSRSTNNSSIVTEILSTPNPNTLGGLTEVRGADNNSTLDIKKAEEHTFKINQIEFNDSEVSFDNSGVLIRYSYFCIAEFEDKFALHREAYKMSSSGTIIDYFVSQPKKGTFEYGARVYKDSSSILGVIISSKPIEFRHIQEGLEIDATALVARGYMVQISASSNKYPLKDKYNAKKIIKRNEMKNVEIEIINRSFKKPLIEFSLEFN